MIGDGTIKIHNYEFMTTPIEKNDTFTIWNVNVVEEHTKQIKTFEQKFLYDDVVEQVLPQKARHRAKVYSAFRGNVITDKSVDFEKQIIDARSDFNDSRRNALIVQAFVDELYRFRGLGRPPEVIADVALQPGTSKSTLRWNVDFNQLGATAGPGLRFEASTPLTAGAQSSRLIWSAAQMESDLYLPDPMSTLVGDKLFEATAIVNAEQIIDQLQSSVEFPDVRLLINSGKLDFDDIFTIRKKAKRFRRWLQSEAERDRDAIIAYHNEVANEHGLLKLGRKTLRVYGLLGGAAAGSAIGSVMGGPVGAAIGGAGGASATFLADVVSRVKSDWKPVVFGNWLDQRIKKLTDERK